jgi:hypothetical protein
MSAVAQALRDLAAAFRELLRPGPQMATLVYVCSDCLAEVSEVMTRAGEPLPPAIEIHNGDSVPFRAYKHYCRIREADR